MIELHWGSRNSMSLACSECDRHCQELADAMRANSNLISQQQAIANELGSSDLLERLVEAILEATKRQQDARQAFLDHLSTHATETCPERFVGNIIEHK